ncbi:TonB-dependent receptor domain-containing protein [Blastomonas aquatica]|uniref:TonB-dependent receptor n=1 Tax=Blastomonas aquatica TaxID=1510276 RepID=A0ABQ1JGA5_9SPHN|nr:TonB-dependent receptor [Blastomonas aquatica]GGB66141.1 TonB-dependent receptor [Blastomonas aquatica]
MSKINTKAQLVSLPAMATALAISGIISSAAYAQDAQEQVDTTAEQADGTIIVTGSRLQRDANATAPQPISTVTAQDLRLSGNTDSTATLRQIPALISSGTVADSIERGAGGIGQATLNLRQLGSNRTLVVVDGWRHVSGVAGSQTVDVATIPNALIERVEVLTGGASAVYGADAVTGVVNYVLKRDFEGLQLDAQASLATEGAGGSYRIEGTYGKNFSEGRGNITFSAGYTKDLEVLLGQRSFTRNNGRGNNSTTYENPLRRFQQGDINPATMPNFASRFTTAAGRFPYGFAIPTAAGFSTAFPGLTPTPAEQALIDRAAGAPLFAIGRDPKFAISSGQGLVFRRDFGFFNADINGNGINDCEESYIGFTGFGGGGCYVTTPEGGVRIFRDGIISTAENQFGGDGAVERTNETSLIPESERIYANLRASFEFSPEARVWVDAKYTRNNTLSRNNYNTFYDSLLIFADNPFIPAAIQADADEAGGLRVSRDMLDLGANITRARRETYRIVGGLEGELTPHLRYEFVGNYGRTDNVSIQENGVLYDRLFAAIDVVRDPATGQQRCRSDTSNVPHPGSQFFPVIYRGFFTFRPGDGQCRPANILAGTSSISADAVDFITTPLTTSARLEQTVFTAILNGDTGAFFNLPGGPVQFSIGAEYRKERSQSFFDPLRLGLLPEGSPAGPAGTFIGDIPAIGVPAGTRPNQSLVFDAATRLSNVDGSFNVKELFGEIDIPLLRELPFAHELSVGAAGRYADYSTVGGTFTWNVNGRYAPVRDLAFRGTYSRAIRAPNISELFNPAQGVTFRPSDPCNQATIDGLVAGNAANAQNRLNNCRAAGIPVGFRDPLTARFSGTREGNPNLTEETATTWTVGGVFTPSFIPGLTVSADYYSIKITDAINVVSAQDIVNTCYDLDTFPNVFCSFFDRNTVPTSPTFRGFTFLRQQDRNLGRIETSGVDFQADLRFTLGSNNFALRVAGNWTERLNRFFDPLNPDLVNPGLRELGVPEWAGFGSLTWNLENVSITYGLQYIGSTAVASDVQIERLDIEFGPAGLAPDYWLHNMAATVDVAENFSVTAGINNISNKEPYLSSSAYPVSGIGRTIFVSAGARF